MARNIKIFNQESNQSIIITSDATTWAQLRNEINSDGRISANNKSAIIRETKVTLEFDDSILPEGEFILFLFPVKVKSGVAKKTISDKAPAAKSTAKVKTAKAPVNNSLSYKEVEAMIKAKTKMINATIKDSTRTLKQTIEKEFSKISATTAKELATEAKGLMKKMSR